MNNNKNFEISINSDYIKEINEMYLEEENELELGIHPTQIKERVEKELKRLNIKYNEITFMCFNANSTLAVVDTDHRPFGYFDYEKNYFKEIF